MYKPDCTFILKHKLFTNCVNLQYLRILLTFFTTLQMVQFFRLPFLGNLLTETFK